jgi:hypothetical protein
VSTLAESTEGVVTVVVETEVESPSVLVSSVEVVVSHEARSATAAKINSSFFMIFFVLFFFILLYIIFLESSFVF